MFAEFCEYLKNANYFQEYTYNCKILEPNLIYASVYYHILKTINYSIITVILTV